MEIEQARCKNCNTVAVWDADYLWFRKCCNNQHIVGPEGDDYPATAMALPPPVSVKADLVATQRELNQLAGAAAEIGARALAMQAPTVETAPDADSADEITLDASPALLPVPPALTSAQVAHLTSLLNSVDIRLDSKYRAGAIEHGGNLTDMGVIDLIENAIGEAIDQLVYLLTLRSKFDPQP